MHQSTRKTANFSCEVNSEHPHEETATQLYKIEFFNSIIILVFGHIFFFSSALPKVANNPPKANFMFVMGSYATPLIQIKQDGGKRIFKTKMNTTFFLLEF